MIGMVWRVEIKDKNSTIWAQNSGGWRMILDNSCPACVVLSVNISILWVVSPLLSSLQWPVLSSPPVYISDLTNISSNIVSVYLQLKTHSALPDSFISSKYKITSKYCVVTVLLQRLLCSTTTTLLCWDLEFYWFLLIFLLTSPPALPPPVTSSRILSRSHRWRSTDPRDRERRSAGKEAEEEDEQPCGK